MYRRQLMLSAGAAALSLAGAASAQTVRTLKFGYILPEESSLGAGAKVFEDEIMTRTGGRYKITQYPNGALGDEAAMLKDIQLGKLDLAFVTSAPLPNFVLEAGVFSIPFIFSDASHAHDMLDGPIGLACLEKFCDKGTIGLAWGENGFRQLTNSKRPIKTPEDLKGLKFGVPQSAVMMIGFEALGADVSAVAYPELFNALQSGQFDGQDNSIAITQATKLWKVQRYLTLSSHIYDPAVILMSSDAHRTLAKEDQAVFAEAAQRAGVASRQYAAEAQLHGIETLRA